MLRTETSWMTLPFLLLALFAFVGPHGLLRGGPFADDDDYPKVSPFEAVAWQGDRPQVTVGGTEFELVSLDGHAAEDIVAFAQLRFGDRWRKRFEEDLPWLLGEMGHPVGRRCELVLADDEGEEVTLAAVELTEANRRAIWLAAHAAGGRADAAAAPRVVARVERDHATSIDPRYEGLAWIVHGRGSRPLDATAVAADLDQLEWHVRHEHSYRDLAGIDVAAAFDAARAGLLGAASVDVDAFGLTLAKLVGTLGDGHGRVRGLASRMPGPYLPLLVFDTVDGPVAVRPDRSGFADPKRPRVTRLDGVDVERWIEAAARFAPQGSDQARRYMGTRNLRYVQAVRTELGLPLSETIDVELARLAGDGARTTTLALGDRRPIFGEPPLGTTRRIGDVGYLRVPRMDDGPDVLAGLSRAMDGFRDTRGLVIDVRANGGGSRAILRHLMPYFLEEGEDAIIANVARYRLRAGDAADDPHGFLANRWLHPAAWSGWSDAARAAIAAHAADFEPEWSPPQDDEFSALHWFVLERSANPAAYRYVGPVVVLLDGGSFSATDVFLGAFAGRPNVTLVGTPSGGGSGRSQRVRLAHSGLELRLSTMVSYRPDGRLYDGRGIAPDVTVVPTASDVLGRTDRALERALERLRAR